MVVAPFLLGTFQRQRLSDYKHVGDIENLSGKTTRSWAFSLYKRSWKSLETIADQGQWGAKVNCQQFARKLLLSFTEHACRGDSKGLLVDCYCTLDMWLRNSK